MDILTINQFNIDQEDICCANSDKKGETCLFNRKEWMKSQFVEGLTFKKLNLRGKVFIEYQPAEAAWCPISAPDYLFIKCFWVSGQYKGKGYANALLEECLKDAKEQGKAGLVVLSSPKKKPFLSDPKYLKYKGFKVCDTASPYFELLYLPIKESASVPAFKDCCKNGFIDEKGFVLYYSDQCPYAEKYSLLIAEAAKKYGQTLHLIKYTTGFMAREAPSPFTIYSLFYDRNFITNEIQSEAKFIKLMEGLIK